ncbi:ROK family transcriptional regulator [Halobacillus amylolyticus]|uniref:ROK family protein n=1 Tax=Halobacillus amylolyticus TaxID=2932259 RepID=A0ABY4HA47_9BACI|nr:ROK family transcriptional regulator [Halobacillus amylolyticus]UOR11431.1 ROK family protein [Halobacillus amylolyticus]
MSSYQQSIKSQNKIEILQTIIDHAPLSRTSIAKKLGMAKGTVSSLSTELIDNEIIYEYGPGSSSGGRRPVMLLFNEKAAYSIGINVGVNYILGVLTNLNGEMVAEQRQSISVYDLAQVLPIIIKTIQRLIEDAPSSPYGIIGIGVGVPGIVNHQGTVLFAPNLGWENVHLKGELENTFDIPVTVENEANAGAYGEKKYSSSSSMSNNIVYVSAGIGIGVGLIIDGKIYRGEEGYSGELGHMMIDIDGRKCSCGSQGCWEMYASEKALLLEAEKTLGPSKGLSLESLIQEAETNPEIKVLFEKIGDYLGAGVSNILNIFNPKKVVIGNRLALAKNLLNEPVRKAINRNTLDFHKQEVEITFSSLTPYSTSLGTSRFMVEKFITTTF